MQLLALFAGRPVCLSWSTWALRLSIFLRTCPVMVRCFHTFPGCVPASVPRSLVNVAGDLASTGLLFTATATPGRREPRPSVTRNGLPRKALGHNSKAVHRAYAKRALMRIPSLQEYEERAKVSVP